MKQVLVIEDRVGKAGHVEGKRVLEAEKISKETTSSSAMEFRWGNSLVRVDFTPQVGK